MYGVAKPPKGLNSSLQAQYLTDPRLALAQELMKSSTNGSPVATPLEGLLRVAQGGLAGYQQQQVKQEYENRNKALVDALSSAHNDPDVMAGNVSVADYLSKGDYANNPDIQERVQQLLDKQMDSDLKLKEKEQELKLTNQYKIPDAPSGYRYAPGGALEAIPGGPATKVAAEAAGKISLAKNFNENLPNIRKNLVDDFNILDFNLNRGDAGRAARQMREAIGGALYLKTGAAATPKEVDEQSSLYMPSSFDTQETRAAKVDALEKFLGEAQSIAGAGRGPDKPVISADQFPAKIPAGTQEDGYVFMGGDPGNPASWRAIK